MITYPYVFPYPLPATVRTVNGHRRQFDRRRFLRLGKWTGRRTDAAPQEPDMIMPSTPTAAVGLSGK